MLGVPSRNADERCKEYLHTYIAAGTVHISSNGPDAADGTIQTPTHRRWRVIIPRPVVESGNPVVLIPTLPV